MFGYFRALQGAHNTQWQGQARGRFGRRAGAITFWAIVILILLLSLWGSWKLSSAANNQDELVANLRQQVTTLTGADTRATVCQTELDKSNTELKQVKSFFPEGVNLEGVKKACAVLTPAGPTRTSVPTGSGRAAPTAPTNAACTTCASPAQTIRVVLEQQPAPAPATPVAQREEPKAPVVEMKPCTYYVNGVSKATTRLPEGSSFESECRRWTDGLAAAGKKKFSNQVD